MIPVNKPFLPDLEEYQGFLKGIWQRNWLTNHGPLVSKLEEELARYLGVKHLFFVNNGTIAIQIALKAVAKPGKVITTPFSYVATTSSLVWEGYKPVFADIEKQSFNIDPDKVEELIDDEVTAILATHVYGNPCLVERLEQISEKHGVPVLYDAAHAFGTHKNGKGILNYGLVSTCSFHATKLFHTIEGGALATNDDSVAEQIKLLRNFGHLSSYEFGQAGINGKSSEFNAAMGLANLNHIADIVADRARVYDRYNQEFEVQFSSDKLAQPAAENGWTANKSYYPVVFSTEEKLKEVVAHLEKYQIYTRRYFYPSLNLLPYLQTQYSCPVSEDISCRVLCLPMYYGLSNEEIVMIASKVKEVL